MQLINHPVLCNYYVTYRCNAKCHFCDIWERPSHYVDLKTVEKNLEDMKKLGVRVIDFTGGEPLLHREIDQLLQAAKEKGFITTLTTNGMLYPKCAERIRGLVDMLHFSLDFAEAEKHNKARGVKCFEFVMESIEIAKDLGEKPDILFTAFGDNIGEIEKVYRNIVLPNDLVLILNPAFDYNGIHVESGLSDDALDELESWSQEKNVYLNKAFIDIRRDGGNHINSPVCKAGSSTVVISPEDKLIVPCYHLEVQEFPIKGDLFNLFHSEKVKKIRAMEGKLPECEGCVINCYMQPSFAVEMNKYWWRAIPSTLKYNRMKGTWKKLIRL